MASIISMISWMQERLKKVNYQLGAWGPSKYDCSSAVYSALIAGDFLPQGTRGYTDTLFGDLERTGWKQILPDGSGNIPTKRGDIFIWGERGNSANEAGHTGIFVDDQDNIIHCNFGYDGITINDHDYIWMYNGQPEITIYRYTGKSNGGTDPKPSTPKPIDPVPQDPNKRVQMSGTFYPDRQLAVSQDTNPDDVQSPALDYYTKGMAIRYDSYIMSNGYAWISYIGASGKRRYVAVGPDDGHIDTTWGRGFFN